MRSHQHSLTSWVVLSFLFFLSTSATRVWAIPMPTTDRVLWLKADALGGTYNNNDPVDLWPDMGGSGPGSNAIAGSSAHKGMRPAEDLGLGSDATRPTFQTNAIGGLPAVQFDGVDDFMQVTNSGDTGGSFDFGTGAFEIYLVFKPLFWEDSSNPNWYQPVLSNTMSPPHWVGIQIAQESNAGSGRGGGGGGGEGVDSMRFQTTSFDFPNTNTTLADNGEYLISATRSDSGDKIISLDGGPSAARNHAGNVTVVPDVLLGQNPDALYARNINMQLAELVVFAKQLSDEDGLLVEGLLAWKYGLQGKLPDGHLYQNVNPIPEPSTLVLLVLGAVGIAFARQRQR